MATHPRILAWKIPWTEKPGRLQSMELQRVGHNLATKQQQQLNLMIQLLNPILFLSSHITLLTQLVLFFSHTSQLVGSQFPDQGIAPW